MPRDSSDYAVNKCYKKRVYYRLNIQIAMLWERLSILEVPLPRSINAASIPVATSTKNLTNISNDHDTLILQTPFCRCSKAPLIESFTGEELSIHWDNWLPTLERAATWNNWSEPEKLI